MLPLGLAHALLSSYMSFNMTSKSHKVKGFNILKACSEIIPHCAVVVS